MFYRIISITAVSLLFAGGLRVDAQLLPLIGAGAPECARNYTVRLGDTCNKISAELNVSTYQLAIVNNKTIDPACDNLAEGEPLCLGLVGEDCTTVHVVTEGDSCSAIDNAAGIDLQTLVANNPQISADCTNIYPGEVLCVADEIFDYQ